MSSHLARTQRRPWGLRALFVAIVLYAAFGKGFAYAGVPPLFVSELLLVAVVLATIAQPVEIPRNAGVALSSALFALAATQAANDLTTGRHQWLEIARGLAPVYYAMLAFAMYALLRRDERRIGFRHTLQMVEDACRRAAPVVLLVIALLAGLLVFESAQIPTWPSSDVAMLYTKAPDIAVTLVLLLPLLRRQTKVPPTILLAIWCGTALIVAFRSRGALLGLLAGTFALWPRPSRILKLAAVAACVLALLYATGLSVSVAQREVSFDAATGSIRSLLGGANDNVYGYADTRQWREEWWTDIWSDVVARRQVLHGHGWGDNLAIRHGIISSRMANDALVLRLPHNIFLSVAGRAGLLMAIGLLLVPGFAIARSLRRSGGAGVDDSVVARMARAGLVASIVVSLTDTFMESPQGGILVWSLVGLCWWIQSGHLDQPRLATPHPVGISKQTTT